MGKPEHAESEGEERKPRFSQEQYDMLLRCSQNKDMTEWNEWRNANPDAEILLEGAELTEFHLEHANLALAHLDKAELGQAHLEGANLTLAFLSEAHLNGAHLQGARLSGTFLKGTLCYMAVVDGATLILDCSYDRETDFTGVGLGNARISPGLRSALEANVRRFFWRDWYSTSRYENGMTRLLARMLKQPVRLFWAMSDYGESTARIIATFFGGALLFALIYFFFPGFVAQLHLPNAGAGETFLRSCYFSVVTMTTLGFGDMHAQQGSIAGYFLLMFQVILGYVILGALVTRLAVLFRET